MAVRKAIKTHLAPEALGPYSQAISANKFLFISGQIPLLSDSMEMVEGDIEAQARQVFNNLSAVAQAANARLDDAVKINISMVDLTDFTVVNTVMAEYFAQPYPARACVQVVALPKNALIEVEATLAL